MGSEIQVNMTCTMHMDPPCPPQIIPVIVYLCVACFVSELFPNNNELRKAQANMTWTRTPPPCPPDHLCHRSFRIISEQQV